jgi:short-subunit dehydrogenase
LGGRGYNICLICRNREKGEGVIKELKEKYGEIKTKLVITDYAKSNENGFIEKIKNDLLEMKNDIAILVNNAGIDNLCPFDTMSFDFIKEIVNVNVIGHVLLTRFLLP